MSDIHLAGQCQKCAQAAYSNDAASHTCEAGAILSNIQQISKDHQSVPQKLITYHFDHGRVLTSVRRRTFN